VIAIEEASTKANARQGASTEARTALFAKMAPSVGQAEYWALRARAGPDSRVGDARPRGAAMARLNGVLGCDRIMPAIRLRRLPRHRATRRRKRRKPPAAWARPL